MATATFALTGGSLLTWMHGAPFLKVLARAGYTRRPSRPVSRGKPASTRLSAGDILHCRQAGETVHAAFYLGQGFVFEKPGQDFYEPYRLARWAAWKKGWAHTRVEVWSPTVSLATRRQSR